MPDLTSQFLDGWDYVTFASFFVVLSVVGYLAGSKERSSPAEYFLAGRKLPWYVVGGSFIASNISSEHFIEMIGAAFLSFRSIGKSSTSSARLASGCWCTTTDGCGASPTISPRSISTGLTPFPDRPRAT